MSINNGTATLSLAQQSPYNYIPSEGVAITMLVLFGVSTLVHSAQAVKYGVLWLVPTACLCGVIELLGWAGRLWSSFSPLLSTPFQIEITCTIVAPTPLLAANFVILGNVIKRLGPAYSRLSPKWYTIIFTSCDVISLVVQGLGGGIAASASDLQGANNGAHIMLGGIVFQLVVIVLYSILAAEYFFRYHHDSPIGYRTANAAPAENGDRRGVFTFKLKAMSCALVFSTTVLFIRAVYRTIELADGWKGRIISNQLYFNVLDGAMVILAMYTMNFINPGIFLAPPTHVEDKEKEVASL
ncbi:RTA1-like protein [Gymnopilus junonius]|uniref:RTA1-like protein n=1 Tax=Gymnopilus junonius TaxID=109634 RepID=A0A9P5NNB8_GYMJU|nr:RTA1-like protein [Gymnopilus junonius]